MLITITINYIFSIYITPKFKIFDYLFKNRMRCESCKNLTTLYLHLYTIYHIGTSHFLGTHLYIIHYLFYINMCHDWIHSYAFINKTVVTCWYCDYRLCMDAKYIFNNRVNTKLRSRSRYTMIVVYCFFSEWGLWGHQKRFSRLLHTNE